MTTTSLGMALPQFKEEYGDGRPFDVVGTLSHDFMSGGMDDPKPTGFTLEKNGNFQFLLNLGAQLVVENWQGVWEDARSVYM